MKVKVGSVILGFVMICIGIAALAGQTPVFGIHPIVWFILGAMLICSDSAWEKLAHAKRHNHGEKDGNGGTAASDVETEHPGSNSASDDTAEPSNNAADLDNPDNMPGKEAAQDEESGTSTPK